MDPHQGPSSSLIDKDHWQSALGSIEERLEAAYNLSKFTDLTISFPGHPEIIKVHRFILAISSPVFECMLFGPLAEGDELKLPEDPPEAFKWLMQYIYCGFSDLPNFDLAVEVYHLARKYHMDALVSLCSEFLRENLDAMNLPVVYDTAFLHGDRKLLKKCREVVITAAEDVFSSPDFGQLSRRSMKHLLQQELHVTSEVTVFNGLMQWGTYQFSKKSPYQSVRQVIVEFLPLVRFLAMTLDEFVEYVIPSEVLTPEESNTILMNIKLLNNVPIPSICSQNRNRRISFDLEARQHLTLAEREGAEECNNDWFMEEGITMFLNLTVQNPLFIGGIEFKAEKGDSWLVIKDSDDTVIGEAEVGPWEEEEGSSLSTREVTFVPPVLLTPNNTYKVVLFYEEEFIEMNGLCKALSWCKAFSIKYGVVNIQGEHNDTSFPVTIYFWSFKMANASPRSKNAYGQCSGTRAVKKRKHY